MMIDPSSYVNQLKDASYPTLINERKELLAFIEGFEEQEKTGDRSGKEWSIYPQPDVRYQTYLEYLSELCSLMKEKYNENYVWGDRRLSDDFAGR